MFRFDLVCSFALALGLPACSDSTTGGSAPREVRYSGTVSQPAPGGFLVYRMSGVWKLDANGALITGVDSTKILDAAVYGVAGTATFVQKTRCVAVVGKEAWAETEVTESSSPQLTPVGTIAVLHFALVGGVAKGGGGPRDLWYPTGNICADKPANLNSFDMKDGSIVIP